MARETHVAWVVPGMPPSGRTRYGVALCRRRWHKCRTDSGRRPPPKHYESPNRRSSPAFSAPCALHDLRNRRRLRYGGKLTRRCNWHLTGPVIPILIYAIVFAISGEAEWRRPPNSVGIRRGSPTTSILAQNSVLRLIEPVKISLYSAHP